MSWLTRVFSILILRRKVVLTFAGFVFLASAFHIKNLQIILDTDKLLPPDHPYTQGSRQITKDFGLKYTLVASLTQKTGTFESSDLADVARITREVAAVPGVIKASVSSLTSPKARRLEGTGDSLSVKPFYRRDDALPAIASALNADSFFRDLLVSRDATSLYVLIDAESPSKGFRDLQSGVVKVLGSAPQLTLAITGFVPMMAAIEDYSDRVAILLTVSMVIIGALLYLRTGSVQGAVLPIATGLTAVLVTLGVMGFAGVPIDVFNAITPVLILAVIAGHSTQILSTYTANLKTAGLTVVDVPTSHRYLVSTMVELAPVLLAAGLAAAAGFWSLMVFSIQSIWTFGLMAGTAIAVGVVLELTVVPALRACLRPPKLDKPATRLSTWLDSLASMCASLVMQRSGFLLAAYALVLVACVGLSTRIMVENSNKANIALTEKIQIDDQAINAQFPGTNTLYVMLDTGKPDGVKDPAFIRALESVGATAQKDPSVGRTVSYADHIKRLHKAVFPDASEPLPNTVQQLNDQINLYELGSSPNDFSQFVNSDFSKATVIALMKDDSSASMKRIADGIKALQAKEFSQYKLFFGGSVAEAAAITEQLVHDKLLNMAQVLGVVALIAAITFRSFGFAVLVVLPLVVSVFFNFGLMALLGIPLNIPTALCAAMVVGLGADYGIYFLMKYRRELAKSGNVGEAIDKAINSAGSICLGVAVLIAMGYSVLILSYSFLPHRWIGMLVVSAMLVSAVATITLVPALLLRFSGHKAGVQA